MKNTQKRSAVSIVLCITLALVLVVGGTFAWLSAQTTKVTNTFTLLNPVNGMTAEITEVFDPTQAQNLTPGVTVDKEVAFRNTSTGTSAPSQWACIRLRFMNGQTPTPGNANMTQLNEVMQIIYNSAEGFNLGTSGATWVRKNSGALQQEEIFYYNTIVAPGTKTANLFTDVKIKSDATNAELKAIYDVGGFQIEIDGSAVQSDIGTTLDATIRTALEAELP